MNPNRRFLVLVLSLSALSGLAAQTAIDQLYGVRKYELADAYYAAGQRFTDLGQTDRGAEFKAKAQQLFPGYVPGQAPGSTTATPVVATPEIPSVEVIKEKNLQGEKIARLQFQKLLRGYLTGSTATVSAVLGAKVQFQDNTTMPDTAAVAAFLQANPAEAGTPGDLFDLDTLQVNDGAGQSVIVTIQANASAPSDVTTFPFWMATQDYTFDRVNDTWKLVKIVGRE